MKFPEEYDYCNKCGKCLVLITAQIMTRTYFQRVTVYKSFKIQNRSVKTSLGGLWTPMDPLWPRRTHYGPDGPRTAPNGPRTAPDGPRWPPMALCLENEKNCNLVYFYFNFV